MSATFWYWSSVSWASMNHCNMSFCGAVLVNAIQVLQATNRFVSPVVPPFLHHHFALIDHRLQNLLIPTQRTPRQAVAHAKVSVIYGLANKTGCWLYRTRSRFQELREPAEPGSVFPEVDSESNHKSQKFFITTYRVNIVRRVRCEGHVYTQSGSPTKTRLLARATICRKAPSTLTSVHSKREFTLNGIVR